MNKRKVISVVLSASLGFGGLNLDSLKVSAATVTPEQSATQLLVQAKTDYSKLIEANKAVKALKEGKAKKNLVASYNKVAMQIGQEATVSMIKAKTDYIQLTKSHDLIYYLPEGRAKFGLAMAYQKVSKEIENKATALTKTMKNTPNSENCDKARRMISYLPEGAAKANLLKIIYVKMPNQKVDELLSASAKMSAVKAYDNKATIALSVKADNLSKQEIDDMSNSGIPVSLLQAGLNATLTSNTKTFTNDVKAKIQSDLSISCPIIPTINTTLWADASLTTASPVAKIVLKVPDLFKAQVGGKDYLVMDTSKIPQQPSSAPSVNYEEIGSQFSKILLKAIKSVDYDNYVVEGKGTKDSMDMYEVKINGDVCNNLLRKLTNDADMKKLMTEIMSASGDTTTIKDSDINEAIQEISKTLKMMNFNLTIEYGVKDGVLVYTNETFNVKIDSAKMAAIAGDTSKPTGIWTISGSVTSNNTNLNGVKETDITLPTCNDTNSIDLMNIAQ